VDAGRLVHWARAAKVVGLELAELSDAWRIFPRAFCSAYGYLAWEMWEWFSRQPDVSAAQSIIVTGVIGLCVPLLGLYFSSGRKWGAATNVTVQMPPIEPTAQPKEPG
jgi:hypothetical protein